MTLRVQAEMNVDGKQASVELKKLVGEIADTKIAMADAKAESAKLKTELKGLNRETAEGAARAAQLKEAIRGSTAAEVEAAAAASRASRAYDEMNRSQGRVAASAGQVRAATLNLGQQIGDIGQGLALGISPATIFAQQAGQVGFAMSGLGGVLGRVGGFLAGPWGAALTVGAIGLGVLTRSSNETAQAARVAEDGTVSFATEAKIALETLGDAAEKSLKPIGAMFDDAVTRLQNRLPSLKDAIDQALQGIDRLNAVGADLFGTARTNNAGNFATERARRIDLMQREDRERKFNEGWIGQFWTPRFGTEWLNDRGDKTAAERAKAAAEAQRKHNAELREMERAARKAAEATKRLADETAALFREARGPAIGSQSFGGGLDSLGLITDKLDDSFFEQGGRRLADGFLTNSVAIGQVIGGSAGRALSQIAGLAQGTRTGDFTGAGGQLGGALTLLASNKRGGFSEGLREVIGKPIEGLKDAFKDVFNSESGKAFARLAGRSVGGAAVGSAVAGIGNAIGVKLDRTGSSIGGAVGGALGPAISKLGAIGAALGPFAGVIGGVLGGLLPGLFGSRPKGSTTVSASGGQISQSSTGNSAIQKATGAIGNTITDAIQAIAEQLGASIGDFSVSIGKDGDRFRVDTTGQGRTRKNNTTVLGFGNDEGAALAAAIADALKDGAIKSSPRVQAALTAYGDNVNKAVAEALKVKGLEDLLADRNNPFTSTFRTLEQQLKQRLEVARKYGFDLVEIERVNGEDRAKALKDTLGAATGSIRQLLNDLQFGSGATGNAVQRLAGLTSERDRLTGLARAGDTGQLDAIAAITQQIDQLQREAFGSTAGFATGRADSVALLNDLVRQTEDRIKAAAEAARTAPNPQLTEANASLDDLVNGQAQQTALLAQLAAGGFGGGGLAFDAREFQR
jgi:hypothetical protein